MTSITVLFCSTIGLKPKDISFTMIYDKEKQQIISCGAREHLTFWFQTVDQNSCRLFSWWINWFNISALKFSVWFKLKEKWPQLLWEQNSHTLFGMIQYCICVCVYSIYLRGSWCCLHLNSACGDRRGCRGSRGCCDHAREEVQSAAVVAGNSSWTGIGGAHQQSDACWWLVTKKVDVERVNFDS